MSQLQIAYLLRSGTQERWRRLCQELSGPRQDLLEAVCQQAGIIQLQVRLLQLQQGGELMLLTLHTQDPQQAVKTSICSFDFWLQTQLQSLLGWTMPQILADLREDVILLWSTDQREERSAVPHVDDASSSQDVQDDDVF